MSTKITAHIYVDLNKHKKYFDAVLPKYVQLVLHVSMSLVVRKTCFLHAKNKETGQLCGNREADQRLCFRYTDSKIPLLPKSKISRLWPSSVAFQLGLCRTRSETPVFSERSSYISNLLFMSVSVLSSTYASAHTSQP